MMRLRLQPGKRVTGMGMGCEINLIDTEPTEKQEALFIMLIRALEDKPDEFVIFEFQNAKNRPDTQRGLVFFQLCRDGRFLNGEIRIDRPEGMRMYRRKMNKWEAADWLRWMIRTRQEPDIKGWEDITKEIFGEEKE